MPYMNNPLPVGVGFITGQSCDALLLIRRGKPTDPGYGKWALPGGYQNEREDWTDAIRREIAEEVGLDVSDYPVTLAGLITSTAANVNLVFGSIILPVEMLYQAEKDFQPNEEVAEISYCMGSLLPPRAEWAFPIHWEQARAYLNLPPETN
jgi:8-oxo-dGTP pyrophosphatase MutT (NUDIX family)